MKRNVYFRKYFVPLLVRTWLRPLSTGTRKIETYLKYVHKLNLWKRKQQQSTHNLDCEFCSVTYKEMCFGLNNVSFILCCYIATFCAQLLFYKKIYDESPNNWRCEAKYNIELKLNKRNKMFVWIFPGSNELGN